MARKKRSKESYYGNAPEARRMQRANLIPGDQKRRRKIQGARYDCWWELSAIKDKQLIFEAYENDRDYKDVPEEELKGRDYLNNWWSELVLESKISIYKKVMSGLTKESRSEIFKDMEKCLKGKLERGI
ncbi:hypothetical protein ES695_07870 [Candidatus Atribacteria bacterium 1244-E10-H5-B2]|nr:MAG: hypothetical protein ES695_07870 [Candidatus Atribacteria bacterium 1244-E10-H5-B2]